MTTTTPPPSGVCRGCGHDWPLTPTGLIPRHPVPGQPAAFGKKCRGKRKTPRPAGA